MLFTKTQQKVFLEQNISDLFVVIVIHLDSCFRLDFLRKLTRIRKLVQDADVGKRLKTASRSTVQQQKDQ